MTEPVRVGQLRRWHVGEDLISPFLIVDVHRENDIKYVEFLEEERRYRFRADEVEILSEVVAEATA